ncbi:hypothetical protein Acr_08g0013480 [Actinidia rufa]|uniref:Uncharacterized protein n=1 Tax=Actinidia rufa TaxID=165716 RepID=A0A7J0F2N9_9ERIC|nr:hypothetical protein Acr_08g0013480 [Actinidia rufa]
MDVPNTSPPAAPPSVSCPPVRCSTRVRTAPSYLCDYHCYCALFTLHEPRNFREASSNPNWKRVMKDELDALDKTHTWDIVDLPSEKSKVGCKWVYKIKTQADGTIDRYLSQTKYASDLLSRAGLTDNKTVDTLLENNVRINTSDGEPLSDPTLYRQLVGSLIYLTDTRPDISHAMHIVSQFMSAPRSIHYATALRILRYVKGFHGLHFSSRSSLTLRAYSDADWVDDPTNRRSTTGYCFFLGNSLISWRSKKQFVVARSSTEAEYHALADATSKLLWLRWLIQDLGIDSPFIVLHCDNHSAIQIAHNDVFHKRTKYIENDYYFIHHHLQQGVLHLVPVRSIYQPADLFTKTHPTNRFRDLLSKLKLVSSLPP